MMIHRLIILLVTLCTGILLSAQVHSVQGGEYYWDTDPGQGMGTAFTSLDGGFNEIIETAFMNTTTLPSVGAHRFFVRFRNDLNSWGPAFSTIIQIEESIVELREIRITAAEYFWDNDPGEGNGSAMIVYDGNFNEAIEQAVMSTVMNQSIGNHTFHIRVRDAELDWSEIFSVVIRTEEPTTSLREISLTEAEYFWDTDPGEGNATAMLALDGSFDEEIEKAIMSSLISLSIGNHIFHVRVRDAEDAWSSVFRVIIEIDESTTALRNIEVTEAEYFWDNDPGEGNGNAMIAFDGNFNEAIEQSVMNMTMGLSIGNHILHIRMKDAEGDWSPAFKVVIRADEPTTSLREIYLSSAEYWFDADPGAGNGTPMLTVDGNFSEVIEAIKGGEIPSPVTMGVHVLWMRGKEPQGEWGPAFGIVVNMDIDIGTFNTAISGPSVLCSGSDQLGAVYTCVAASGSTYLWSITGGTIISGQGTTSVTVNWNTGSVHILTLEQCIGLNCQQDEFEVIIEDAADQIQNISICEGDSYFTGGANQTQSGTYTDEMENGNGCSFTLTTYLSVVPAIVNTISVSICQGESYFAGGANQTQAGSYADNYTSSAGCDSTVVTELTVHPNYNQNFPVSICEGQSYFAAGALQTESGFYTDIYSSVFGCDSVVVTQLNVIPAITSSQNVTICEGESFFAGGAFQTESGTYVDVIDDGDCTETLTTYLAVVPLPEETQYISICEGETYYAGGAFQSENGIYTDPLTEGNCTGTLTTILTVHPSFEEQVSITLCQGQSVFVGGDWQTQPGVYTDEFTTVNGCDSTIVTVLSFTTGFETEAAIAICEGESIILGGALQTEPGVYTDLFESTGGCDSLVYTTLTIISPQTYESGAEICEGESILLGGELQTEPGVYVDIYNSSLGCDSIVITTLTVHENYNGTATEYICQGDSIFLAGNWQFNPGIYTNSLQSVNGCDSIVITTLNVLFPPSPPELVAISFGEVYCSTPSDMYLWSITIDECEPFLYESSSPEFSFSEVQDLIECPTGESLTIAVQVTNGTCWSEPSEPVGFGSVSDQGMAYEIELYPNPADDQIVISCNKPGTYTYTIHNGLGQIAESGINQFGSVIPTHELSTGTYVLSMKSDYAIRHLRFVIIH